MICSPLNLTFQAWQLWYDGKVMEFIDPMLTESSPMNEVLRLVQIGLICVQEDAMDRPTMSSVVLMLGSQSMILPRPTEPPLYVGKRGVVLDRCSNNGKSCSSNEVTISDVEPR